MNIIQIDKKNNKVVFEENGKVYEEDCKPVGDITKSIFGTIIYVMLFNMIFLIGTIYIDKHKSINAFIENKIQNIEEEIKRETHGPYKPLRLIRIWEWGGGEKIDKEKLSETIYAVMKRLNMVEDNNLHDLIMETCAVETDFGYIVKQQNGPALSMYQILPSTFKYTLDKIKNNNEELYKKIMYLYDHRKGDNYNFVYNVPFTTAICMLYYLDVVKDINNKIKTKEERARVWKQWYNTPLGKGTVDVYLKRTNKHLT